MIYGEHNKKFVFYKVNEGIFVKLGEREEFGYRKGYWYDVKVLLDDHKFSFYVMEKGSLGESVF